jgi:hypothetical protein
MKKTILFLVLIVCGFWARGQDGMVLRHVKGQKLIGVGSSYHFRGYSIDLGVDYVLAPEIFASGKIKYERAMFDFTRSNKFMLDVGINHLVYKINENMYLNGHVGLVAGIDYLAAKQTPQKATEWHYGPNMGISFEYWIGRICINPLILQNTMFGNYNGRGYVSMEINVKYPIF